MYVSATVRYEAASLNPLSKRGQRGRGQRADHPTSDEMAEGEPGPEASVVDPILDDPFDAADEPLDYSPALAVAPVETNAVGPGPAEPADTLWTLLAPVEPAGAPATQDASLFALLDRVAAKP